MAPLYSSSSPNGSFPELTLTLCAAAIAISAFYYYNNYDSFEGGQKEQLKQAWKDFKELVRAKIQQQQEISCFTMKQIGTVRSIYQLCVGTPRQGLLASHTRGRIELISNDPVVEGLEGYSHIWVIFVFHLNTSGRKVPAKIAPPALGGEKVGVLATRSPHRPNPIGMTLCKLESIERQKKKTILHLTGLDLVDGTPVLDIKPFVSTYDSVPSSSAPSWVTSGLRTKRRVIVRPEARFELQEILTSEKKLLNFYGQKDESKEQALESILLCIEEVLAVDVRSSWQTKKVRNARSQAERSSRLGGEPGKTEVCTQQLDQLLLSYTVEQPMSPLKSSASRGSGAEDIVTVHSIELFKKETKTAVREKEVKEKSDNSSMSLWESSAKAVTNLFSSSVDKKVEKRTNNDDFTDPKEPVCDTTERKIDFSSTADNDDDHIMVSPPPNTVSPPFFLSPDVSEMSSPIVATEPPQPPVSPSVLRVNTKPPEDEDYHVLKDYWHQAAAVNTPNGMVPSDEYYKKSGIAANSSQKSLTKLLEEESSLLSDISHSFEEDDNVRPPKPPKITRRTSDNNDDPVMIP
mmetsp:Transcript_26245/g.39730  ORF Transcript_26245/g.39730 Transcript_26245/m.39730 type:complete len:575 (+) Transcript_26245:218-1942(+)